MAADLVDEEGRPAGQDDERQELEVQEEQFPCVQKVSQSPPVA